MRYHIQSHSLDQAVRRSCYLWGRTCLLLEKTHCLLYTTYMHNYLISPSKATTLIVSCIPCNGWMSSVMWHVIDSILTLLPQRGMSVPQLFGFWHICVNIRSFWVPSPTPLPTHMPILSTRRKYCETKKSCDSTTISREDVKLEYDVLDTCE